MEGQLKQHLSLGDLKHLNLMILDKNILICNTNFNSGVKTVNNNKISTPTSKVFSRMSGTIQHHSNKFFYRVFLLTKKYIINEMKKYL